MIKPFRTSLLNKLSLLILSVGVALSICAPIVTMTIQNDEVIVEHLSGNEPVKIVALKAENANIQSGKSFIASNDWLKNLSATIKNRYRENVNYVEIGVIVLRTEEQKEQLPFHYVIRVGNRKKSLRKRETGFNLRPEVSNDEADLRLSDRDYADIRKSLNDLKFPAKIKKIQVQVEEVGFADGTIWSVGSWYRGDDNEPEKLIRIRENA